MSPRRSSQSTGGLVVTLIVGVLAVTAVLLAVFALRVPSSPDAGEVPGPIPTWGGGEAYSTPTPTSSRAEAAANPSPQFLSMYDQSSGIRATAGSCAGAPPVVQRTADGGVTWTSVTFEGMDVRQVLGLNYVSESQIDVIAAVAGCAPTVVSSFTGGEFWQAYPERIGSATFVQPIDPSTIRVQGADVAAPCTVRAVQLVSQSLAALCSDGSVIIRSAASWIRLDTSPVLAMAPFGATSIAVAASSPSCASVLIRSIDIESGVSTDLSCLDAERTEATLNAVANAIFYWSAADFFASKTGGISWSPAGG